jgi:hypothetical protein
MTTHTDAEFAALAQELDALKAELASEKTWHATYRKLVDKVADQRDKAESHLAASERANGELRRVIEADRVDFVDLNEYWNGGNGSAVDACTHTCEITELALKRHAALTAPASGGEKGQAT